MDVWFCQRLCAPSSPRIFLWFIICLACCHIGSRCLSEQIMIAWMIYKASKILYAGYDKSYSVTVNQTDSDVLLTISSTCHLLVNIKIASCYRLSAVLCVCVCLNDRVPELMWAVSMVMVLTRLAQAEVVLSRSSREALKISYTSRAGLSDRQQKTDLSRLCHCWHIQKWLEWNHIWKTSVCLLHWICP